MPRTEENPSRLCASAVLDRERQHLHLCGYPQGHAEHRHQCIAASSCDYSWTDEDAARILDTQQRETNMPRHIGFTWNPDENEQPFPTRAEAEEAIEGFLAAELDDKGLNVVKDTDGNARYDIVIHCFIRPFGVDGPDKPTEEN